MGWENESGTPCVLLNYFVSFWNNTPLINSNQTGFYMFSYKFNFRNLIFMWIILCGKKIVLICVQCSHHIEVCFIAFYLFSKHCLCISYVYRMVRNSMKSHHPHHDTKGHIIKWVQVLIQIQDIYLYCSIHKETLSIRSRWFLECLLIFV